MKKPISILLLLVFVFACNKPDKPEPPLEQVDPVGMDDDTPKDDDEDDNPVSTGLISINLDGVTNLDLDALKVTFPSGESEMDINGTFEDLSTTEFDDLPALVELNEEVLMGYFPETLSDDKASLEDILFYYFQTYPEISIRRIESSFLMSKIKESLNFETMKNLLVNSLDASISPLEDETFVQLIRDESKQIIENINSSESGKEIVGNFKIEYQRDGTILIPRKAPLFASLGLQIRNSETGEVVYGPSILETEGLVLSPGSLSEWILREFVYAPDAINTSFKLPSEGTYEIGFTNGNSNLGDTTYEVNTQNRKYFAVTILSYVIPLGLEKMLADAQCKEALIKLLDDTRQLVLNLITGDKEGNFIKLLEYIKESAKTLVSAGKCYLGTNNSQNLSNYTEKVLGEITKRLGVAEDMAELLFFTRDFYLSDISGLETRNFNNDISFGELELTNVTEPSFELEPGEDAKYEGFVFEKVISYDVDRGVTSEFKVKEDFKEADGLPFISELLEGDASLTTSSTISTDPFGNIDFGFAMGEQNSKIKVKPDFEKSGLDEFEVLLLKKEENNQVIPDGTYYFSCQSITDINEGECIGTKTGNVLPHYSTHYGAPLPSITVLDGKIYNGNGYGNTTISQEIGASMTRTDFKATYSKTEDVFTMEIIVTTNSSDDVSGEFGYSYTEFQETKSSFSGVWNTETNEYVGNQTFMFTLNSERSNNNPDFEGWSQNANCEFVYACSIKLNRN